MRALRVFPATLLAVVVSAAVPGGALAYEDRLTVGATVGAGFTPEGAPWSAAGALGGATLSVGLDDVWMLRTNLEAAVHPGDASLTVGRLGTELLYTLDIVEWVPFFGGGIDALGRWSGGHGRTDVGFHLVCGVDRWFGPGFLVGIDLRSVVAPFAASDTATLEQVYFTAALRAEWVFDL